MIRQRFVGLVVITALLTLVAACDGKGSSSSSSRSGSVVPGGVLKVGADLASPPSIYLENGSSQPIGVEVDLMKAIGDKVGFKAQYVNTQFDGLIPALKAHRFDVIMAQLGDYTDRQKVVDLVDYMSIRGSLTVRAADAPRYKNNELFVCGKTVGAATGTSLIKAANNLSAKCTAAGKPAVKVTIFPDDASIRLALQSGRVDGHAVDALTSSINVKNSHGKLASVLPNLIPEGGVLLGIAVPKSDTALRDSLAKAINELIADGQYAKILAKWSLSGAAIKKATVNGGTTSSQ